MRRPCWATHQPNGVNGQCKKGRDKKSRKGKVMDKLFVVRDSSGLVDSTASLAKFSGELAELAALEAKMVASVGPAVHTVFDTYLGESLTTPTLTAFALQIVGTTPSNYAQTEEAVRTYIKSNSVGDAPAFKTTKGKGGGVSRICDAKPAAASESK